jgi:NAD(P)-dependent dehydrogenase (short-subunit alcohol dehydrogenase family)
MADLTGQVAIVTGAGSGIGRATAKLFLEHGAHVVAVDVDERALEWCAAEPDAVMVAGSIADGRTNDLMVETAYDRWGRLDIAVLNAGIPFFGSILDDEMAEFDRNVAINLRGTTLGLRAAARVMSQRGAGAIVVTASTSGILGDVGLWGYNATKAALINLVRSAGAELAPFGVRVNAVCPGPTLTGIADAALRAEPELEQAVASHVPMRRWAQPREIAAAIEFLASGDASFITATSLVVDGGLTSITRSFDLAPLPDARERTIL